VEEQHRGDGGYDEDAEERTPAAARADLAAVGNELSQVLFGGAALTAEVMLRALGKSAQQRNGAPEPAGWAAADAVDGALGLAWLGARVTESLVAHGMRGAVAVTWRVSPTSMLAPVVRRVPGLSTSTRRWRADRAEVVAALSRWSTAVAPAAGSALATLVDVNGLIADAMRTIRIQQVAELIVSRLDLDALAEAIVARLDVGRLVDDVLGREDMTALVSRSIRTVDLEAIAVTVLSQLRIADLVVEHVDLDKVVEGAFQSVDMTQLILDRIDLVRITEYVVEAGHIPDLVRDSTMTLTSETVEEMRRQGITADEAVARFVSRFLRRSPAPA
jgi:hypothetical protein